MIGVCHLYTALKQLDAAANESALANGQLLGNIIIMRMEKNQFQCASFIFAKHPIRTASTTRRPVMLNHKYIKSGNGAIIKIGQRWALAPVNQTNRQMPQNINHMLSNPLFKYRCQLDTDTGKACGRRKKLKYLGGAL